MKFGFVGLGQMGAPMAINLARESTMCWSMIGTQLLWPTSMRSGAKGADRSPTNLPMSMSLITCLPAATIVNYALFDPRAGLVQHLKAGALVVDTSTIEYGATLEIRDRLQAAGLRFLDAPVSGMQATGRGRFFDHDGRWCREGSGQRFRVRSPPWHPRFCTWAMLVRGTADQASQPVVV